MVQDKGRLFFLDIGQSEHDMNLDAGTGRILTSNTDGSDLRQIVSNLKQIPDGIAIDHARQHIWWTNMGVPSDNDGSIHRCDLDGGNIITIVPSGKTHTPKQCIIAPSSKKLYWCDREGMRVMRSNLDGSDIETLIVSGTTRAEKEDRVNHCVGIAVDEKDGKFYWTQKGPPKGGQGRILRANIDLPANQSPESRTDVELLFDGLPEPIDLELDEEHRYLYWTDRGAPPKGNTVNRIKLKSGQVSTNSLQNEILVKNLHEGIGIALDLKGNRMFFGDLEGSLYESDLDGKNEKVLMKDAGDFTGVAYVEME